MFPLKGIIRLMVEYSSGGSSVVVVKDRPTVTILFLMSDLDSIHTYSI